MYNKITIYSCGDTWNWLSEPNNNVVIISTGHLCPDIDREMLLYANFSLSMQLNQIAIRKLAQFIAADRNNEKRPIVKRTLSSRSHADVNHEVCNVSLMPHYRSPPPLYNLRNKLSCISHLSRGWRCREKLLRLICSVGLSHSITLLKLCLTTRALLASVWPSGTGQCMFDDAQGQHFPSLFSIV